MVASDYKIRRPLRVTLLLPLLLMGALAGGFSVWTAHRLQVDSLTEQVLARAEVVVNSVDFAAETVPDLEYLQRQVAVIGAERDVLLIAIAAGDPSRIVASTHRAWLGLRVEDIPEQHVRTELKTAMLLGKDTQHVHPDLSQADFVRPLQLAMPGSGQAGLVDGTVIVYLDLTSIDRSLMLLDRKLFTTTGIMLLIFGVLAYWLITRRVIRPAEAVLDVMRRQERGDSEARVLAAPPNEIGLLARALDGMLDAQERAAREVLRSSEALAESETKLKAIIDNAPALISIKDLDGRLLLVNERFRVLQVPPPEEIVGKNLFDLFPPDVARELWNNDLAALHAAGAIEAEEVVRHKDGKDHTYLTVKFPLNRENGEAFGICAISTDITERKQAENALRESEARYRTLIDTIPHGILENDLEGRILYCNPAFLRMVGFKESELLNMMLWDLFPDPSEKEFLQGYLAGLARGESEPVPYQGKNKTRDGELIDIQMSWASKRDTAGKVVGLISVITNITEKLRAEKALLESQGRLSSIVSSAMDAIVTMDEHMNIVLFNNAAERIFGYQAENIIGKPIDVLLPTKIHGKHASMVKAFVNSGATMRELSSRGPIMGVRASGEEFAIEASISQAVVGDHRYLTAILRDVSDRIKAEEEQRLAAKVFENSREGIMIMGADRKIVAANKAFARMSGYQPGDVIGEPPLMLASGQGGQQQFRNIWTEVEKRGTWQGEVWNRRKNGEAYPAWVSMTEVRDAQGGVMHYIGQFFDISDSKEAEARIQRLAFFDALTDLPNRILLADRMRIALAELSRREGELAILFLDLDRFKNINDSLGHIVGDALLQAVADRLRICVRENDTVARLGGDEFILMLPGSGMESARRVSQTIIEELSKPFAISDYTLNITPSIGISLFPVDGRDADTLLKNADAAMYHAKDSGRSTYRFFREELNTNALERLRVETQLRQALENNEFELHFQPQVDLKSGRIIGAEALLRWSNAELGSVSPARFIPVAEDSGLIVPIGRWVIREACRVAATWRDQGFTELLVAVNLSVLQFQRDDLVETISRALDEVGLAPSLLELELTESLLLEDYETTLKTLHTLKQMGVRLSIDDFGTGYSSMSYLKKLDIDKLKIDQSFVRDLATNPDDEAIVKAIIQMAHSLQLTIIAEGVEDQTQLRLLKGFGCDEAQGYLISRPLAADVFARLLDGGAEQVAALAAGLR